MSEWVKRVHTNLKEINNVAHDLLCLASAFEATGNFHVADSLIEMSKVLQIEGKNLQNAIHEEINRGYKQAEQSSANVLNAVLTGMQLGRKEDSSSLTQKQI